MTSVEEIYDLFVTYPRITTDSRNVPPDSIFFAIKGDLYDGNSFAAEALEKGAIHAIVSDPAAVAGNRYSLVPDTLLALQQLASHHRRQINAKIIGITGSNGKTTTKELVGRVLGASYPAVITRGNLNNHIGVPLTLLSINKDTEFAIIEMGANHPGEIAGLCRIARPDYGIITNIGKAHLEGFGSFEGVVRAKSELFDFIRENDGLVFINLDNDLLCKLAKGMRMITYGSSALAGCSGTITERYPYLSVRWRSGGQTGKVDSKLFGDYNFENIMAAICIGLNFGIAPELIEHEIGNYQPDNNRSQMIKTRKNILILDAYNANPSSMKAALVNFAEHAARSKMIILGDMMELGEYSHQEHLEIVDLIRKLHFDKVVLVGEIFGSAAKGGDEICFGTISEVEIWLQNHPVLDQSILVKGSRKMQLERIRNLL
ncbi:MAG: UDP-N-acetylmuramoyl-tripeptide--D-alanyl-D-alanine ligase [Bacteroidales bacterium]|nr:UDP-N-acetylmuramoyl-tripeptide--D-alanyl-D-alanine ligase [Bacteroidales bacterium]